MRPIRLCLAAPLAAAALTAVPSLAAAAAPPNDNYLASTSIASSPFTDVVLTAEATTQPDLFNPSRSGQPLGGAGPESTTCNGTPIGKTVWYDLQPKSAGGVEVETAGFDATVAVYEWNPADSKITKLVSCANTAGPTEDVLLDVVKGKAYTFQVGGAGGAAGLLSFSLDYFPDSDGDTVLDALDKCKTTPGIERFGGCPPDLKVTPSIGFDRVGGGVRISSLVVANVPKGAKVVARAAGGSQTIKVQRAGRVELSKLVGRTARAGSAVEVRVTMGRSGTGKYKYGATGAYFKWPVKATGLAPRVSRCLKVGSSSKIVSCS